MNFHLLLLTTTLVILSSCKKTEITSIWVPKESTPNVSMPSLPGTVSAPQQTDVLWTKPASWQDAPASSMRVASFSFQGKNGGKADISVVRLAGDGGGQLANINRWRGQIQLDPISESEMNKAIDQLNIDGHPMAIVHLVGKGSAMLAAIYSLSNESWYFKLTGDDKTVAEAKPSFYQFIKSIKHPH